MKVKSNIALAYSAGREGIKNSIIEISISVNKNTEQKTVNVSINDSEVLEGNLVSITPMPGINRRGLNYSNEVHTYAEFQAILDGLEAQGTYTETGLELEDILVQEYLYQKVTTEKWYDSAPEDWDKI